MNLQEAGSFILPEFEFLYNNGCNFIQFVLHYIHAQRNINVRISSAHSGYTAPRKSMENGAERG
jgi:hypothetical protein